MINTPELKKCPLTIGSLFSGIGGLELGLERAGVGYTVWQVEIDPFCRDVLARHWPHVIRYSNVKEAGKHNLTSVDILCGGFPCQDISTASHGRGKGLKGSQSGLWREFARIINELTPLWVVIENVSGAAEKRWLPNVRRDLYRLGYTALPIRMSADYVGAPFKGLRCFVVAEAHGNGQSVSAVNAQVAHLSKFTGSYGAHWREPAPWHLGVANGIPHGMDRLRALGNAVVPQCAELIGRALLGDLL